MAERNIAEPEYELYAIRYATREARRSDHFIGGDPHDGPMAMDYFVWVARGGGRTFVIDTGFNAEVGQKRKRSFRRRGFICRSANWPMPPAATCNIRGWRIPSRSRTSAASCG